MRTKKRFILSCLTISLFVMLILTNAFPQDFSDDIVRKHLVAYFTMSEEDIQFISSHFDITVSGFQVDAINQIKQLNPDVISFTYYNTMATTPSDKYWSEINTHEDWFIHGQLGHRLRDKNYCWYLMDVGNDGWRNHYATEVKKELDISSFDGIFADDVWGGLWDRWFVDIVNEVGTVTSDNTTITTLYQLWEGTYYRCGNKIGVYTNPEGLGLNYYTGGSFTGHTITLGTSLPAGTTVYINYSSIDASLVYPPQGKKDSWINDMTGFLQTIKTTIYPKLIVINGGYVNSYLNVSDGFMDEAFVHSGSDLFSYNQPESLWKKHIDNMVAVSNQKIYLAQSGIKYEEGLTEEKINKTMRYCFGSYLLGMGENSTFYFQKPLPSGDYPKLTYYPEWDVLLGSPMNKYYLLAEGLSGYPDTPPPNLIQNPSFENAMTGWGTYSWEGSVASDIDTQVYKEGNKSIKSNALSGSNTGGTYQYISIEPNTTYTLSGWIRTENLQGASSIAARLYIYPGPGGATGDTIAGIPSGDNNWQYVSTIITTGNDTTSAYIYAGQIVNANGTAWFDDIRLEKGAFYDYKVYARDFNNGKVLVNPTYASCTIELEKPYKTLDGEIVESVDIGPHEGIILLSFELQPRPPCEGDLNHDGDVDSSDLTIFAAAFGSVIGAPNYDSRCDFDGDGDVDSSDLAVFAEDFGRTDCPR